VQPPDDDVTTVVPPAVAVLVEPLTMPLPAVIEVATPPAVTLPRLPLDTTVQPPVGPELLPVTIVAPVPPEVLTLAELLAVCPEAVVAARHPRRPMSE
jgi:hypothetical protein